MPGITNAYIEIKVERVWNEQHNKPVFKIVDIFGPSKDCVPPAYLDDPKTTNDQKAAIEVCKAKTLYDWNFLIRPNAEDLEQWYHTFEGHLWYDWRDSTERGKLRFYIGTFLTPAQWELLQKVLQDAGTEFIKKCKEWLGYEKCLILL